MSENFTPKPTNMNYTSRHQSPVSYDHDHYTPPPYRETNTHKPSSPPISNSHLQSRNAPEMFHLDTKRNNLEPRHDEQSFKSSSPLIHNSYPVTNARPEVYHIGGGGGGVGNHSEPIEHNSPYKPSSPPIQISYPSTGTGPEMYHLTTNPDNSHPPTRHPSPAIRTANRVSPMPMDTSDGQHPVVYSIQLRDENHPQTLTVNHSPTRTQVHNTVPYDDHHEPGKITMYSIATENRENHPPATFRERTPSPPVI